jgi:hypothetical protein
MMRCCNSASRSRKLILGTQLASARKVKARNLMERNPAPSLGKIRDTEGTFSAIAPVSTLRPPYRQGKGFSSNDRERKSPQTPRATRG